MIIFFLLGIKHFFILKKNLIATEKKEKTLVQAYRVRQKRKKESFFHKISFSLYFFFI
jgi:hypothetical protein